MTQAEKQDIIKLITMFKPYDLQDEGNKRVAEAVDEITNAIEGMADTKDWIDCSDMMPPERENVICYSKLNGKMMGMWVTGTDDFENGVWIINDGIQNRKCVTHWMYLPESPEEDDDEPTNHCEICGNGISDCEQICKKCETKYNIKWGDKISQKLHEYIVKIERGVKG